MTSVKKTIDFFRWVKRTKAEAERFVNELNLLEEFYTNEKLAFQDDLVEIEETIHSILMSVRALRLYLL